MGPSYEFEYQFFVGDFDSAEDMEERLNEWIEGLPAEMQLRKGGGWLALSHAMTMIDGRMVVTVLARRPQ